MRNFSDGPWLSKTGIYSRQDAKNAKSGNLISLRPLRLCGRYSGFGCGFAALGDTLEISSWKTTLQPFAVK
jgi:hypothetical protein